MSRRSYVIDVWLSENGSWLVLACAIIGCVTAPEASGLIGNAIAWLGTAVAWFLACLFLVGLLWRPWGEPVPERRAPPETPAKSGELVPLRPTPQDKGLH